ncbi:MAG TPA: hypothetical protein ENH67_14475 [Pseudoalteromonas sp.]|nr:hypothetical protein [Pseudoalteromonas sp.]
MQARSIEAQLQIWLKIGSAVNLNYLNLKVSM